MLIGFLLFVLLCWLLRPAGVRTKLSASVPFTLILVMSKTLRFLDLVLAQIPSCFSIRSEAKLRPHKEHATRPSLPPAEGPVAKIDLRGIVVVLLVGVGDSKLTGFGANFGFVAGGDGLTSTVRFTEGFYRA
jgi:hypothetical protein